MYKANKEQVVVFGMKTKFGGGRSTGFGLIYDSRESMNFEPRHRLVRVSSMNGKGGSVRIRRWREVMPLRCCQVGRFLGGMEEDLYLR